MSALGFRWESISAVLFDLDGVVTDTARVHASCWKTVFDAVLRVHADAEHFEAFDIEHDYLRYVDGKPRVEGVQSFLQSRRLELPLGQPESAPGVDDVHAIARWKTNLVLETLKRDGVVAYPGSVRLLRALPRAGIQTAVVSASRNCAAVLEAAALTSSFAVRVDGVVQKELGLCGKPAPDPFLEAARQLGVAPQSAMVIEDAIAGVQSGKAGGFRWVVGVDRHAQANALQAAGADLVVRDLSELPLPEAR